MLFENMLLQFLHIMEENYIILKAIALFPALNIHIFTLLFASPLTSSSAQTDVPPVMGAESWPASSAEQCEVLPILHSHFGRGWAF